MREAKHKRHTMSVDLDDSAMQRIMGTTKPTLTLPTSEYIGDGAQGPGGARPQAVLPSPSEEEPASPQAFYSPRSGTRLSSAAIQSMFEGAPYFTVRKTKSRSRPEVIVSGVGAAIARDMDSDFRLNGHPAFDAATLSAQQPRSTANVTSEPSQNRVAEIPNMLSANGYEVGTTGFEHYLQLPVAEHRSPATITQSYERRKLLYWYPERFGLKNSTLHDIVDRLNELGVSYTAYQDSRFVIATVSTESLSEMGERLFKQFLVVPKSVGTANVPIRAQIEALQNVLGLTGVWHDFSDPNTRMRVGEILWSSNRIEQSFSLNGDETGATESELLLLQISLASELLLRLKIVQILLSKRSRVTPLPTESEVGSLEDQRTVKVDWDLILAERFLRSVEVSAGPPSPSRRTSSFSVITPSVHGPPKEVFYIPKLQQQQLDGLKHFATVLRWQEMNELTSMVPQLHSAAPSQEQLIVDGVRIYPTPPSRSPLPKFRTEEGGYFGRLANDSKLRGMRSQSISPHGEGRLKRVETLQSVLICPSPGPQTQGMFQTGTWLSRSWLSGFVLPGDAAGNLLMSTLLERSPKAIQAIGETANLRTGFVYQGFSYWSKKSVVGRVMAAARGASECMGWISVPHATVGQNEGWVRLSVLDSPQRTTSKARISEPDAIGQDSDPLGSGNSMSLHKRDFIHPHDGLPVLGNEVTFMGLRFEVSGLSTASLPMLNFASPLNTKLPMLEISLTYDVQFVSAYPCRSTSAKTGLWGMPSPKAAYLTCLPSDFEDDSEDFMNQSRPKSPTSIGPSENSAAAPCHPLHIDYQFETIPVAKLLTSPADLEHDSDSDSGSNYSPGLESSSGSSRKTMLLDCRGPADLQLLARAWCAREGHDALVSRASRTCIACSVREARALGLLVVIRV